jgi:hypothetical protein
VEQHRVARLRRLFSWDDLDFTYFAGYATWNYLTTPFLLPRPGFTVEALGPLRGGLAGLTSVHVTYPDDIPAHCRRQVLYFDEHRLLNRLDYTAEVVGGWAHAAHFCDEYRDFGGLKVPIRRRVLRVLPWCRSRYTSCPLTIHDARARFKQRF